MNSSVSEKTIINNIKIENKNSRKMVTNTFMNTFMINLEILQIKKIFCK